MKCLNCDCSRKDVGYCNCSCHSKRGCEVTKGWKEIFKEMLTKLENRGECSYKYHELAKSLFSDDLT